MRGVRWAVIVSIALGWAGAGQAQTPSAERVCTAPGPAPSQSMRPPAPPAQPQTPACIDQRTNTGRCNRGVIDRFNAEVDAYNRAVQQHNELGGRYVDALNAWSREASSYANCEVDRLNAQRPRS